MVAVWWQMAGYGGVALQSQSLGFPDLCVSACPERTRRVCISARPACPEPVEGVVSSRAEAGPAWFAARIR